MDLAPDLRDLLVELGREAVEYVIVGGYAVAYHGRPRFTKDIDLVLEGSEANLARAAAALDAFGAAPSIVENVRKMELDDIVFMGQPPMRVDFLRTIEGVDTRELFLGATRDTIDEVPIRVISLDHLIANKRSVGRPQDLIDVEFLERARERRRCME